MSLKGAADRGPAVMENGFVLDRASLALQLLNNADIGVGVKARRGCNDALLFSATLAALDPIFSATPLDPLIAGTVDSGWM
ncbi:hypothetical protein AURDEDRAFT_164224 [Auricularia subglabra TFB-10046 SS5]|nr:hypothetical protein AURDEDRAFT_164224 [Auricularia subglabra TFB-10046 SS5]